MATRINPILKIPVNFGNPTDLVDAALTLLGSPTIYIPENSVTNPVTFLSVTLHMSFQDVSTVTGATITETRGQCTLAAASASTITDFNDLTHTGENQGGVFGPYDFTAYFNANFGTGSSKVCDVKAWFDRSTGTGLGTRGVYAWFEIQYTFNDSEASRIKTIAYDLESITGSLIDVANTSYGTIMKLTTAGGLLNGYASPVIRYAWAMVSGNCGNNNVTTDHNINYSFDGSGSNALPTRESALASDTWQMYQIDLSSLATGSTHTLDLWASLANRWYNLSVTIYVTYEYAVSGTTRILNYLELPINYSEPLNGTTTAERSRQVKQLLIAEPGTITQHNISVNNCYLTQAAPSLFIKGGAQASFRTYTSVGFQTSGMYESTHLLDSRSTSGAAMTLVRGNNSIEVDVYRGSNILNPISGMLKVLYESDVPAAGIDASVRCVYKPFRFYTNAIVSDVTVSNVSISIPEADYYLIDSGVLLNRFLTTTNDAMNILLEINAGELLGDGWVNIYSSHTFMDAEVSYLRLFAEAITAFKHWPTAEGLDIATGRRIRLTSGLSSRYGGQTIINYHAMTFSVAGDITGSNGGTVTINLHRASNDELLKTTSRAGDGAYSFTWYDDAEEVYVVAYEDDTYKGRSANALAV